MSAHAKLSPSSAVRWMACPGSVALCEGLPDTSSTFADEGTDAHELAALCLITGTDARHHIGTTMMKGNTVDADMAGFVQQYVDYVRDIVVATNGELLVEQRLPIGQITGEADAHGTSDVVILAPGELIVIDLKYGRGVAVEADENPQLQIYALAAMDEFSLVHDFAQVRMVIHQPRLHSVSEWTQTVADMMDFAGQASEAAEFTRRPDALLRPTDKGCKFCKAKATCPALAKFVERTVGEDFEDLSQPGARLPPVDATDHPESSDLGTKLKAADLIETWIKAVRAEAEARLLAGVPVRGFKVVQGKKGNRAWTNKEEAEAALKAMRVKHEQMYDYSVISPTSAEKLAKAEVIGPRQWPKLQALITQAEGKPSVAPESDKRPALVMSATADDFNDVTDLACDLA